jgi:hypothetical protein
MRPNKDTHKNFILWYKDVFGLTAYAATALYDVQMLKEKETLSKHDDNTVAIICKAVSKDNGQSVAKLAATRLKLLCFLDQAPRLNLAFGRYDRQAACVDHNDND